MSVVGLAAMSLVGGRCVLAVSPYVLEDGEASSAVLNATYSNAFTPADEKRVAQLVTENPSIPPKSGAGAAKFVFSVDNGPYYSVFRKSLTADLGAYQTGALKFDLYWTGYDNSLEGRAAGKTMDQFVYYMGNASTEIGFRLDLGALGTAGLLQADAWNSISMDLPDDQNIGWPRFRNFTNNTINGQPLPASAVTDQLSGDGSLAGLQAVWTNPTYAEFQSAHAGQGGNSQPSEGFFGIDNAQFTEITFPADHEWQLDVSGNWNSATNWSGSIPNGVDVVANFLGAISEPRTVFTDTPVVLGSMKFDNTNSYQITGQGSLAIDVSTGSGSIQVVQGNHKINLPFTLNDNTTVDIAAGTSLKISNPMTLVGGVTLNRIGDGTLSIEAPVFNVAPATLALTSGVTSALMDLGTNTSIQVSGGTTNLQATQHLASVSVSGGRLNVGPGTSVVAVTKSLSISGNGKVDLQNGKMVIDYTGASSLAGVKAAINAGSLTSSQLTSGRAIGYGEASDLFAGATGPFAGQIIDSSSVVVAYTVTGDASLDGVVSSADFNQLVANYGVVSNARWTQGDFTGDGKVTTLDFNVLSGNFGQSLPPGAALGSVVPEPASFSLILACGLVTRKHRRI
jgi:hypothetical protein